MGRLEFGAIHVGEIYRFQGMSKHRIDLIDSKGTVYVSQEKIDKGAAPLAKRATKGGEHWVNGQRVRVVQLGFSPAAEIEETH